jgi:hypothetical protein
VNIPALYGEERPQVPHPGNFHARVGTWVEPTTDVPQASWLARMKDPGRSRIHKGKLFYVGNFNLSATDAPCTSNNDSSSMPIYMYSHSQ